MDGGPGGANAGFFASSLSSRLVSQVQQMPNFPKDVLILKFFPDSQPCPGSGHGPSNHPSARTSTSRNPYGGPQRTQEKEVCQGSLAWKETCRSISILMCVFLATHQAIQSCFKMVIIPSIKSLPMKDPLT